MAILQRLLWWLRGHRLIVTLAAFLVIAALRAFLRTDWSFWDQNGLRTITIVASWIHDALTIAMAVATLALLGAAWFSESNTLVKLGLIGKSSFPEPGAAGESGLTEPSFSVELRPVEPDRSRKFTFVELGVAVERRSVEASHA